MCEDLVKISEDLVKLEFVYSYQYDNKFIVNPFYAICSVLINGGGNDMINKGNLDGATALHFAAECGSKKICQELLAAGADVSVQDVNENTPLHYCAQRGEEVSVCLVCSTGRRGET
eukprot:sb/3476479/